MQDQVTSKSLVVLFEDACHLNRYKLLCSDRVLQTNDGLEHGLGVIQYELMGTLLLGWIIVYGIIR